MGLLLTVLVGLSSSGCGVARSSCGEFNVVKVQARNGEWLDPETKTSGAAKKAVAEQTTRRKRKVAPPMKSGKRTQSTRSASTAQPSTAPAAGNETVKVRRPRKASSAPADSQPVKKRDWIPEPMTPGRYLNAPAPSFARPF